MHTLEIDLKVYSEKAIKSTIYKFVDLFSADLNKSGDTLIVSILPKSFDDFDFEKVKREFLDELNDQDLREVIAAETEDFRNVIVAKAFANADI